MSDMAARRAKFPGTWGDETDVPQLNPQYHTAHEMQGGSLQIDGYNRAPPGMAQAAQGLFGQHSGAAPNGLASPIGNMTLTEQPNMANLEKRIKNIEHMITEIYKALRKA